VFVQIAVFLNAAGTLSWSQDYEVVGTPGALVVVDLDGDGALDVAVPAGADGSVSILWNSGAAVLAAPVRIPMPEWPSGLVAGDVTGDGRVDLLTTHQGLGQVALLANLGGRAFAQSLLETGVPAEHLGLGDLDQDGDLDLALSGPQWVVDVAWIFMNSGTGTFHLVQQVDSGDWPMSVILGDLDADGDPDLLLPDMMANSVRLFTNRGGRLAAAPRVVLAGDSPVQALAHGDVDGDGRPDLIAAQSAQVAVIGHLTGSTFGAPVTYAAGASLADVAAADVDNDGDVDVVAADRDGDAVVVFRNAAGLLGTPVPFAACDGPSALALEDMDGDGFRDVLVTCHPASTLRVLRNDGTGAFPTSTGHVFAAGSRPSAVATGDLDADGDRDVVVGLANAGRVSVLLRGPAGLSPGWTVTGCAGVASVAVGDLNGDGRPDIGASCATGAQVRMYLNNGDATFAPGEAPPVTKPSTLRAVDLEGDGDLDLAVVRQSDDSVVTMRNDGAGHFTGLHAAGADENARALDAVDWDGDGDADLATGSTTGPAVTTLLNTHVGCAAVTLSAFGAAILEGHAGDAVVSFPVVLSAALAEPVTVDYATADGTAGADDYEPASGTLTFEPGEMQKTVTVVVHGDTAAEADETILLDLSSASGAAIANGQAAGTILNDDGGYALVLDLSSVEGGSGFVSLSPPGASCDVEPYGAEQCVYDLEPGQVSLVAQAYPGSGFVGWTGACSGTGACVVSLTEARQVGASFLGPRTLTVSMLSVEDGHGFVSVSPQPLYPDPSSCDNVAQPGEVLCRFHYAPDTVVTLQQFAYPDSKFLGYGGQCSGTGPCSLTMPATAGAGPGVGMQYLGPRTLTVSMLSVEDGHGFVSVSPQPLYPDPSSCDNVAQPGEVLCRFHYAPDTVVTLQQFAYPDSKFLGYGGQCSGTGPCSLTMPATSGAAPGVGMQYLGPRTLTVSMLSVEEGHGFVSVSPQPLYPDPSSCDNVAQPGEVLCRFHYAPDTVVTLQQFAYPDSKFLGYGGQCSGTGPCSLTMPATAGAGPGVGMQYLGPRTLTASLTSVGGGHGTLTVSPFSVSGADSCVLPSGTPWAVCTFAYAPDTAVTVTAVAAPGSVLSAMGGACPASGPCVVTMSAAATVTATFALANQPPIAHAGGPYAGLRGQAIAFDGAGSSDPDGQPLTYAWTFSDGGTATGVSPTHAFATLGTHTASLVVSDGAASSGPSTAAVTIANALPAVALTAPADGSTHPASGPIALAADALDPDGAVVHVGFYAGAALVGEAFAAPFTAVWSGAAPGTYVLTAQATDSDGATTTSAARTVHLNPAPTVALTAPAHGTVFVAGATVALTATASDDLGVARVEFYAGPTLVGTDTSRPYAFAWPDVPAGRYVLTARAVDSTGGTAVSAPVTIDVARVLAAVADSYVRDNSDGNDNYGRAAALETRTGSSGSNRWTYLRFDVSRVSTVQSARLRLFGNLAATTSVPRAGAGVLVGRRLLGRERDHLEQQACAGPDGARFRPARREFDRRALVRVGPDGVPAGGEGGGTNRGHDRAGERRAHVAARDVPLAPGGERPAGAARHALAPPSPVPRLRLPSGAGTCPAAVCCARTHRAGNAAPVTSY
jgi:PKD repeat protein